MAGRRPGGLWWRSARRPLGLSRSKAGTLEWTRAVGGGASLDARGRRVKRTVVATTPTELARAVERYAERGLRVAVEAGNQTAWIVDLLREFGAKVYVVHP
jgi:hypothetical protein